MILSLLRAGVLAPKERERMVGFAVSPKHVLQISRNVRFIKNAWAYFMIFMVQNSAA